MTMMLEIEGEDELMDLSPYLAVFDDANCQEEEADDDEAGSSARTLLIDVPRIDVTWAHRFLMATQRIPPGMAVERLSCSIHAVFDDDDWMMVLDVLAQALSNCTFREARVATQGPLVNPSRAMELCKQVAKNTIYVLRIADVSADAPLLGGALAGLQQSKHPHERLQLFCELRSGLTHQIAHYMIACCRDGHCNDSGAISPSRFSGGFLFLHLGLVTPGVWTLVAGLFHSSHLRSLQINAREMMSPPAQILHVLRSAVATNTTMDKLVLFFPLSQPV